MMCEYHYYLVQLLRVYKGQNWISSHKSSSSSLREDLELLC